MGLRRMKELNNCYQMEELNEPYTIFVISFISVRGISRILKEGSFWMSLCATFF